MLQQELLHKNHHTCLRSTLSVNSTVSQFNGASSSSSPLLPSKRYTLVLHLTYLVLFLTVLIVFLDHLPPLTSYKCPQYITLFSVPALFAQLLQLFGALFPTHYLCGTFHSFKTPLSSGFSYSLVVYSNASGSLMWLMALYKLFYLLSYFSESCEQSVR